MCKASSQKTDVTNASRSSSHEWFSSANMYFEEPSPDRTDGTVPAKDTFLVQKANIYVTQHLVRLLLAQYMEDLSLFQRDACSASLYDAADQTTCSRSPVTVANGSDKNAIVHDLLRMLQTVPKRLMGP